MIYTIKLVLCYIEILLFVYKLYDIRYNGQKRLTDNLENIKILSIYPIFDIYVI